MFSVSCGRRKPALTFDLPCEEAKNLVEALHALLGDRFHPLFDKQGTVTHDVGTAHDPRARTPRRGQYRQRYSLGRYSSSSLRHPQVNTKVAQDSDRRAESPDRGND